MNLAELHRAEPGRAANADKLATLSACFPVGARVDTGNGIVGTVVSGSERNAAEYVGGAYRGTMKFTNDLNWIAVRNDVGGVAGWNPSSLKVVSYAFPPQRQVPVTFASNALKEQIDTAHCRGRDEAWAEAREEYDRRLATAQALAFDRGRREGYAAAVGQMKLALREIKP